MRPQPEQVNYRPYMIHRHSKKCYGIPNPANLWPRLMKLDRLYRGKLCHNKYYDIVIIHYKSGNLLIEIRQEKGRFTIRSSGLGEWTFPVRTYPENKQVIAEWILQAKAESL